MAGGFGADLLAGVVGYVVVVVGFSLGWAECRQPELPAILSRAAE
jgi:hypothetical protein